MAVLATLGLAVVIYQMLMVRALEKWYLPMLFFSLVTGILYSVSLMVLPAGKITLLKTAGLTLLLINLLTEASYELELD